MLKYAKIIDEKTGLCEVGMGETDEPSEVWGVDAFVKWTLEFISLFNPEKVILLGHSFGGRVVIKIAAMENLPFEIDKIILTGSAGIMPKRTLSYKIKVGSYKLAKKILLLPPVKKLFPNALENMQKKKVTIQNQCLRLGVFRLNCLLHPEEDQSRFDEPDFLEKLDIPENTYFTVRFISDLPIVVTHRDHAPAYHSNLI